MTMNFEPAWKLIRSEWPTPRILYACYQLRRYLFILLSLFY